MIVVGASLGAGSHDSLAGLFASPTMPARPLGVQEPDLPRFFFRDATVDATAAPAGGFGRAFEISAA